MGYLPLYSQSDSKLTRCREPRHYSSDQCYHTADHQCSFDGRKLRSHFRFDHFRAIGNWATRIDGCSRVFDLARRREGYGRLLRLPRDFTHDFHSSIVTNSPVTLSHTFISLHLVMWRRHRSIFWDREYAALQVFSKPKFNERTKKSQPKRTNRRKHVTSAGTRSGEAISKSIVVNPLKVSTNNGWVCWVG